MSYRLQLSPQTSIRIAREITLHKAAVHENWTTPLTGEILDISFLRAWFEADPEFAPAIAGRFNWGALYGMAFSLAFSGACWAGVAWIVTRVWR